MHLLLQFYLGQPRLMFLSWLWCIIMLVLLLWRDKIELQNAKLITSEPSPFSCLVWNEFQLEVRVGKLMCFFLTLSSNIKTELVNDKKFINLSGTCYFSICCRRWCMLLCITLVWQHWLRNWNFGFFQFKGTQRRELKNIKDYSNRCYSKRPIADCIRLEWAFPVLITTPWIDRTINAGMDSALRQHHQNNRCIQYSCIRPLVTIHYHKRRYLGNWIQTQNYPTSDVNFQQRITIRRSKNFFRYYFNIRNCFSFFKPGFALQRK